MIMRKIINIVFYEDDETKEKRARIFYNNNDVEDVSFDEGVDECYNLAKEMQLTKMSEFKELINNKFVHVTTKKELNENINFYSKNDSIEETVEEEFEIEEDQTKENKNDLDRDNYDVEPEQRLIPEDDEEKIDISDKTHFVGINNPLEKDEEIDLEEPVEETEDEVEEINDSVLEEAEDDEVIDENDDSTVEEDIEEDEIEEIKKPIENKKEEKIEPKKATKEYKGIKGFFARIKDKLMEKKIVRRIVLFITALAVGLGIYSVAARKSLEGRINNNNITSISDTKGPDTNGNEKLLVVGDNTYYNEYDFETLQQTNGNQAQKNSMTNAFEALKSFNGRFANAYVEKGKNIKPALSFEEIMALQVAYNDYSKEDIKAIFNGAEITSTDLNNDYKSASLQLMGSYVIETKENPLNIEMLINSEEGKQFYKKYHDMFMKAKYSTGQEQIKAVEEFYNSVRKDFPITKEERTEGISHADSHKSIESYKLSVTPMIAAAEMMFQNLKLDVTLKDSEIDFLNDLGLCNYAEDKFNKVETILLSSDENKEEPTYNQYRNVIVKMFKDQNQYVIDDAHRELSKLDVFKLAVSGQFDKVINGDFQCTTVVTTSSSTNTTYRTEESRRNLPITDEAKAEVDEEIARENASAKTKGQQDAERNREAMQSEADKDASRVRSEVESDNKDMQHRIDNANNNINNGGTVNEQDFGSHDVDFDDEHSDSNGNLDNSVENITTDGSNDKTNDPLPDPNETGRKFDRAATGTSNEELVDQYIEYIAETSSYGDEDAYQYVK